MKKQLMIVGIIIILLSVSLSGCTNTNTHNNNTLISDEEKLIGTWKYVTDYYVITYYYHSDKTWDSTKTAFAGPTQVGKGTWKITDSRLFLIITEPTQDSVTFDYVFSNNYNTITFTDEGGISYTYNRQ